MQLDSVQEDSFDSGHKPRTVRRFTLSEKLAIVYYLGLKYAFK